MAEKNETGTALAKTVDQLPANQRAAELKGLLTSRIQNIEDVLPSNMRGTGEGQRLINRASLYFATKKDLHQYSMASIYAAVLQSVELGIPLDGRLGHIGSFGGDAVFMPDYKGLVMIAKRSLQIKDCYGDFVGTNDFFECGRQGPVSVCNHTPNYEKRGDVKGAYAIVTLSDNSWRYEYMTLEQLDKVRAKSRAKNGPWGTDPEQMYLKTVIRRILKLYVDDPTFVRALEVDEAADAIDVEFNDHRPTHSRVRPSTLGRPLQQAPQLPAPAPMPVDPPRGGKSTPPKKRDDQGDASPDCCDSQSGDADQTKSPAEVPLEFEAAFSEATAPEQVDAILTRDKSQYPESVRLAIASAGLKRKRELAPPAEKKTATRKAGEQKELGDN